MPIACSPLQESLVDEVLAALGLLERPSCDLEGLSELYRCWCFSIPFDSVLKRIHLVSGQRGPLPGNEPTDFLKSWLRDGTGGTCWPGNGALAALLESIGFRVERVLATMAGSHGRRLNHASAQVRFGGDRYLVDASLLFKAPLKLADSRTTRIDDPSVGIEAHPVGSAQHVVTFLPLRPGSLEFRTEHFGVSQQEFSLRHEASRHFGPFNHCVALRIASGDGYVGLGQGNFCERRRDGELFQTPLSRRGRDRFLVEQVGISEEVVAQLPVDEATPHF